MTAVTTHSGVLGQIERLGNRLPDPVFIFVWLIGVLIVVSQVCAWLDVSAVHPTRRAADGELLVIDAASLLSAANLQRLLVEMPQTFTHFYPLGYVLLVMLGAGVAERSGLFATAMRLGVRGAPKHLLTPVVAIVAMMSNMAADAAYVVLIPLAGVLFAAARRHPIAGIAAAFAGVSGGFSANLLPGSLDALLFGITEAAAEVLAPGWDANIAGNWYFMAVLLLLFTPVVWYVTDRVIEPRLVALSGPGPYVSSTAGTIDADAPATAAERAGLRAAGIAALGVVLAWVVFTLGPGTPLIDEEASPEARLTPFYRSLVAGFFIFFLATGWAYGKVVGKITSHRDLVAMMSAAMGDLAYYLVLSFAAAHFVAMFNWSNLGLIFAITGAGAIEAAELPISVVLVLLILFSGLVNLFVGSASAKWALMAPVLVPMLMLLGVSPEMTTAAYRVGDSATNIITPLMVYFPLILTFCQRWQADFGIGSLTATMIPFSVYFLLAGLVLTGFWVGLELPLGPGVGTTYALPGGEGQ
ncbi:MAG: AbgT family transporter [Pseudomonadota bacterium]